jgi:hypothetical protein
MKLFRLNLIKLFNQGIKPRLKRGNKEIGVVGTPVLSTLPFECIFFNYLNNPLYPCSKCVNNVFTAFKRTFYPKVVEQKGVGVSGCGEGINKIANFFG